MQGFDKIVDSIVHMAKIQLLPIVKESPTQDKVYKQVKKGGSTSDGLFTEIQLAEWLNISRTSLAKAIQELLKEGLLVCMP